VALKTWHTGCSASPARFRYAVAAGRCGRDPSVDLRGALTPHKPKHQAAVTHDDLPALLRAIDGYAINRRQATPRAPSALPDVCPDSELIAAEWAEFRDLEGDAPTWEDLPSA